MRRRVGVVDEIPYLKKQQRLTFARIGITDPLSLDDYVAHGGFEGLRNALDTERRRRLRSGDRIRPARPRRRGVPGRHQVEDGARRAGGAEVHRLQRRRRRLRHLLRPHRDGRRSVHADRRHDHRRRRDRRDDGLHLRAQRIPARDRDARTRRSPRARRRLARRRRARLAARASSWKCARAPAPTSAARKRRCSKRSKASAASCARSRRCRRSSACSASRRSSTTSSRSPRVPIILARGAAFYRDFGMGRSRGTLPFQLAGNIKHGGLVELAFGVTLRELLYDYGGGTASGRPIKAVQVGGPLGTYLPESPVGHAARLRSLRGGRRGGRPRRHRGARRHRRPGRARALRDGVLRARILRQVHAVPHRLDARRRGDRRRSATAIRRRSRCTLLRDLCDTMVSGSLCAMGGMTPFPVLSALDHFPEDFGLARAAARTRPESTSRHANSPTLRLRQLRMQTQRMHRRDPLDDTDYGTPRAHADVDVTLEIDGERGHRAGRHVGDARRRSKPASTCPSCAPPTASSRSARAACAWSRSKAGAAIRRRARRRSKPA